jgi:uncharacterized membrane protein
MRQRTIWLSSFGAGAATAFLLDPVAGRRRRHRVGDAATHLMHRASDAASTVGRDLRNRTRGLAAVARRGRVAEPPDDAVIEERVHSALGRVVSHPHAITVRVDHGRVILDGPLPSGEEHRVLYAVRAVPGVAEVESRFDPHIQPAHEASSEAARPRVRPAARPDILQLNWAPATRGLVGGAGAALVGAALVQRTRAGMGLAAAGTALIVRAATNLPFRRLVGIGAGRRAIDVQKAITVDLPVDRVFAFWDNPANLPTVMHHVREVRTTEEPGQWHWTIAGTTGIPIVFVTVLTDRLPDRLLAWKTVEGSTIEHAGTVRFDPIDARRTRIGLRLSYNPPGGALGHAVAALLGSDPKSQLDEDLVRMKTALETGHRAHDVARPA